MLVRVRGWIAGPTLAISLVAISGCDGTDSVSSGSTAAPRSASSRPAPSPAAEQTAAVEAVYRRFWSVSWDVDKQPPARWRSLLASVSVDPQLTRLYAGTKAQRAAGIRLYGQVVPRPSVGRIASGRAEVTDCQDASHAGQADARTGAPKTVGVARAPLTASVVRGTDGRWRVAEVRYRGGSC